MDAEQTATDLDFLHIRKLADLAKREGISNTDMLRRLVDRAYEADLRMHPPVLDEKPTKIPSG
jgi:hypothetical protein